MRQTVESHKTLTALEKFVDKYLSGASIEFDDDDQVVIYTGVSVTPTEN